MANKSFIVQYIIKARDKFSKSAEKVKKTTDDMTRSINKSKKAFTDHSRKANKANTLLRTGINKTKNAYTKFARKAGAATDKLNQKIKKAKDQFAEFAKKAGKAGAILTATVTTPILLMANSLKNAARDAAETESKFATVFKSVGAESEIMAKNLADNFGLSAVKAKELLGDTGDLLSGFGFTGKASLDLSNKVNELAVDLASFTNFSGGAEGASASLTKALLGERESLKSLGIAISEKDVKAKIAQLVAKGQRFESLRQAKAIATLTLATEQSKNAIGDFARTSQDLANQERITSSRIHDLKISLGKVLLPVALKITKTIRAMVVSFTDLSPTTKKAILIFAGIVAILGPLLLIIAGIGTAIPIIGAGFAAIGVTSIAALGPIAIAAGALALAANLIIENWSKVKDFFSGFSDAINSKLGPTITMLTEKFQRSAEIIASLFSSDSEVSKNLTDFANMGTLIGDILGGALDLIIRSIAGVGETLGQVIGAVTTLDFSAFDIGSIKAQFFGEDKQASIDNKTKVDVGVNVGLDQGLKQTTPAAVSTNNTRRTDVGFFDKIAEAF